MTLPSEKLDVSQGFNSYSCPASGYRQCWANPDALHTGSCVVEADFSVPITLTVLFPEMRVYVYTAMRS